MGAIAVLSEELINKIAAGEVVERPASVIKELCENSLDAGAKTVRVALSGSGLASMEIVDDGHGMSASDALLSLGRHATSKLRDLEGLFQIHTMGFRGEALPAIASVSRFTLTTCQPGANVGTRLSCEGGAPAVSVEAPPVAGTRIEVADLFFNTPARRKFMKRDQTELSHCHEAVVRLALAHPKVGFFLEHQGRTLLSSPACGDDLRERIAAALGQEVHAHLLSVEERRLGIRVWGFVASPELTFPTARGLYAFVNRRFIRDRGVNHAILRAFRDALPPGRQPVAVIFLEVDPGAVDVNVHPQKLEVRFADPRGVHDAVAAAVERALRGSPWLASQAGPAGDEAVPGAHYALAVERFLTRAQHPSLFEPPAGLALPQARPGFGTARPGVNEAPPPGYFAQLRPLGMLAGRYWVCEGAGGSLVVVDPHAALERGFLAEFVRLLEGEGVSAQPSLFSSTVEVPLATARRLTLHAQALGTVGLVLEPFGGESLAVRSLPPGLEREEPLALLEALAEVLPPHSGQGPSSLAPALRVLACRAARLAGELGSPAEASRVLQGLDLADFGRPCLHPSVVVTELPLLELDRRSGRDGPP